MQVVLAAGGADRDVDGGHERGGVRERLLAVSTASHHLAVLRASRLVDSRREGPRVVHARTPLGEALVGA